MLPTSKLLFLLSLGLLLPSSVGAENTKPSLRINKDEGEGPPKRAPGEGTGGGVTSNRLLQTTYQVSSSHRPASAVRKNPKQTKEDRESARHHTTTTASKHSSSRPSNQEPQGWQWWEDIFGEGDEIEIDASSVSHATTTVDRHHSSSRGPSNYVAPAKKKKSKSEEASKNEFDYFNVNVEYINSVPAAPTRIDGLPDGSFFCENFDDFVVSLKFYADENSIFENEIFLIKDPKSQSPEKIWNYPIGSFKTYGSDNPDTTEWEADYEWTTCVDLSSSCFEFIFVDSMGTLDDLSSIDAYAGICNIMYLSGDSDNKIQIYGGNPQITSVLPTKYVEYFGNCEA